MRIKRIEVKNFKAVSNQQMDFNGCSAIVTAGNNKGKTSTLSGLIDRLRGEKPELIVKQGENNGYNIIELTDGSKIEWHFTEKSERINYITKEGFKQTTGVISQIGEKFFGKKFDIDSFLIKSAKQQQKELQSILGLNLEAIEVEYKEAYELRSEANRELKRLRLNPIMKPFEVEKPDVESIELELKEARKKNKNAESKLLTKNHYQDVLDDISATIENTPFKDLFDEKEAQSIIDKIEIPSLINVDDLELKLKEANQKLRKFDSYERDLRDYNEWIETGKVAKDYAERCDKSVKDIENKKSEIIKNAKLPKGFDFNENGLTYNGFALSDNQQSSSAKYIASLKLAELACGDVKCLHFDASTLDNNSLIEVQKWADSKDLQILIERPDFDGGEIKYEIINE